MNLDELEFGDIDELTDDEVAFWYSVVQKSEQAKQMRQALKSYLDVRDVNESPRTIKIDSKIVS